MKTVATTLLLTALFFGAPVMAGSGHDHGHSYTPVNQVTATAKATENVASLVNRNKLDKSWATVTASSVEKKVFGANSEWVVVFVNDKITDTGKQKLYVFLTLGGDYIAANYTGN
jgi:CHASE1-domain containing sensor protein